MNRGARASYPDAAESTGRVAGSAAPDRRAPAKNRSRDRNPRDEPRYYRDPHAADLQVRDLAARRSGAVSVVASDGAVLRDR